MIALMTWRSPVTLKRTSDHHDEHCKYITALFVNYTSVKLKKKIKSTLPQLFLNEVREAFYEKAVIDLKSSRIVI